MTAGLEVLQPLLPKLALIIVLKTKLGGAGIDAAGHPLPQDTLQAAKGAGATLLESSEVLSMTIAPVRPDNAYLLFARN